MLKMLYVYVIRAIGGRVVAVKLHSPPTLSLWAGRGVGGEIDGDSKSLDYNCKQDFFCILLSALIFVIFIGEGREYRSRRHIGVELVGGGRGKFPWMSVSGGGNSPLKIWPS